MKVKERVKEILEEVVRMMLAGDDEDIDFVMAGGKQFGEKGRIYCFFLDFQEDKDFAQFSRNELEVLLNVVIAKAREAEMNLEELSEMVQNAWLEG